MATAPARDEDPARALLAWLAVPFVGPETLLALMDHARETHRTLGDLWRTPPAELTRAVRLDRRAAAALERGAEGYWEGAGLALREIRQRGVDLLRADDPDAPPALREAGERSGRRWPYLFAYGALRLLEEPRVALLSSRNPSSAAFAITDALADALARRDIPLVASIHREAYRAAAVAAKRHAGPSVLVLDRGLAAAFPGDFAREPIAPARVWDASFDPDLQLLVSPFGWRQPWSPGSGPRRDALVADLADVLVAVEVRPGGVMERECRRAAAHGKPVLVIRRDDAPAPLAREAGDLEAARLVRWTGSEAAAREIVRLLPALPPEQAEDGLRNGWRREVAQFLVRACRAVSGSERSGAALPIGAFPASGPTARVAAAWSSRLPSDGERCRWLLADLEAAPSPPGRVLQLLQRVEPGGLLAVVVPAAWLEAEELASTRAAWTREAAVRLVVRLPAGATAAGPEFPTAALLLERAARPRGAALLFAPGREPMGRFHLRRYLQEVLAALGG